jgi:hypothetical protein
VNDKITLLLETSKVASRLKKLLNRLDKVTTYQINSDVSDIYAMEFVGEHAETIIQEKYDDEIPRLIPTLDAIQIIEDKSKSRADLYKKFKTKNAWLIDGYKTLFWTLEDPIEIKISEHSVFIKFISIVLCDESTDKLVKQCNRSGIKFSR